jgi:hypothetical protein
MNRNFTNDDLEGFLKQNAEEFRIHPSEKVWSGISKHLSKKRRYFGFTTGGFIILSLLAGFFLLNAPENIGEPTSKISGPKPTDATSPTPNSGNITSRFLPVVTEPASANVRQTTKKVNAKSNLAINHRSRTISKPFSTITTPNTHELPESQVLTSKYVTNESNLQEVSNSNKEIVPDAKSEQSDALSTTSTAIDEIDNASPYTIESVTNLYKANSGNRQLGIQFYFTPTVSYRKLTENKTFWQTQTQVPGAPNLSSVYDVNTAVTHKPDMGVELGVTTKYSLGENVKIRGGLQFNVNRYDIKAFSYPTELATIAYNNGSRGVSLSNYRNFSGNKVDWLQNLYFQLSLPVGAELKLAGNNKTSLGIAGTLQPTYILGDKAYMLSTDYMNYTEVPSLIRRWNVATSVETFVNYSTGKINWQVGPQVRYQILSNFVSKYPVRENLFDFGLKVGISLNKTENKSGQ